MGRRIHEVITESYNFVNFFTTLTAVFYFFAIVKRFEYDQTFSPVFPFYR